MKRFVDLNKTDLGEDGYGFAWFDTVVGEFESHSGQMTWDTWEEFEHDFEGEDLERYRRLYQKPKVEKELE